MAIPARTVLLTVEPAEAGSRLDSFLAARLPELSRSRLKGLIIEGRLRANGAVIAEAGHRVKPGESFELDIPAPAPARPRPEPWPLDILYEDDDLIVLEKPAGMVVHPAPGHDRGTLVHALLAHCGESLSGIGGVMRPGIVHRLDRDVSGLLVVAKNDEAHRRLAAQFSVHTVERAYDAVVWGVPEKASGTVDLPIGRHPVDRLRMAVVERGGKRAVTRYRLLRAFGTIASHLRLELATGRTHQIRVHLSSIGLGIVGDLLYRPRRRAPLSPATQAFVRRFGRLALHARVLGFDHPRTGERLRFERPPPLAFADLLTQLEREAAALTTR